MDISPHEIQYEKPNNLSFNTILQDIDSTGESLQDAIAMREQIKKSINEMQDFFKIAKIETDIE